MSEKIPEIYDEGARPERDTLGSLRELIGYGKELIHLNLSECSLTSKVLCCIPQFLLERDISPKLRRLNLSKNRLSREVTKNGNKMSPAQEFLTTMGEYLNKDSDESFGVGSLIVLNLKNMNLGSDVLIL
jgi:hypothetical protein